MRASDIKNTAEQQAISEQKSRIFGEIKAYRKIHGLGCYKDISEATGGKVAIHTIANMCMGTKVHNDVWVLVGQALEKLKKGS